MARFTDSPYEYMMSQKPQSGRISEAEPPRFPPGHKCHGCPYGRGKPCVGMCMKDLQIGGKKHG